MRAPKKDKVDDLQESGMAMTWINIYLVQGTNKAGLL